MPLLLSFLLANIRIVPFTTAKIMNSMTPSKLPNISPNFLLHVSSPILLGQRSHFTANYKYARPLCSTDLSMTALSWSEGLSAAGLYYDGIIHESRLQDIFELHKRDTVSTFGTRSSRRVSSEAKVLVPQENPKQRAAATQ